MKKFYTICIAFFTIFLYGCTSSRSVSDPPVRLSKQMTDVDLLGKSEQEVAMLIKSEKTCRDIDPDGSVIVTYRTHKMPIGIDEYLYQFVRFRGGICVSVRNASRLPSLVQAQHVYNEKHFHGDRAGIHFTTLKPAGPTADMQYAIEYQK
jgi:hypothetical protein